MTDRRDFLKLAAATGAVAIGGRAGANEPIKQKQPETSNDFVILDEPLQVDLDRCDCVSVDFSHIDYITVEIEMSHYLPSNFFDWWSRGFVIGRDIRLFSRRTCVDVIASCVLVSQWRPTTKLVAYIKN